MTDLQEFISKLTDRLDFRPRTDKPGDFEWLCGRGNDRMYYAKLVASETNFDLDSVKGHYCCDCELVFNLSD